MSAKHYLTMAERQLTQATNDDLPGWARLYATALLEKARLLQEQSANYALALTPSGRQERRERSTSLSFQTMDMLRFWRASLVPVSFKSEQEMRNEQGLNSGDLIAAMFRDGAGS